MVHVVDFIRTRENMNESRANKTIGCERDGLYIYAAWLDVTVNRTVLKLWN